jgi:molecular chaperone GrpE
MNRPKLQHVPAELAQPAPEEPSAGPEAVGPAGEPALAPSDEAPEPAAPPLTSQAIADLKAKAEQAQQFQDQWLRAAADFDNFRKRAARERAEAVRYANEGLLQKLVPVLDNFEMALAAANAQNTTVQALQAGVAMIHQQFKTALADAGLEEIDAVQKSFDPNLHEAVSQEATAEVAEGQVVRQLRKGYRLRDRLLRPASVVVAKALAPEPPSSGGPAS